MLRRSHGLLSLGAEGSGRFFGFLACGASGLVRLLRLGAEMCCADPQLLSSPDLPCLSFCLSSALLWSQYDSRLLRIPGLSRNLLVHNFPGPAVPHMQRMLRLEQEARRCARQRAKRVSFRSEEFLELSGSWWRQWSQTHCTAQSPTPSLNPTLTQKLGRTRKGLWLSSDELEKAARDTPHLNRTYQYLLFM